MLEIIAVVVLYGRLKKKLRARRANTRLALLGPVLWFGGEFCVFVAMAAAAAANNEKTIDLWKTYPYALLGAVIGAVIAYVVVALQPWRPIACPSCAGRLLLSPDSSGKFVCPHCNSELRAPGSQAFKVAGRDKSAQS